MQMKQDFHTFKNQARFFFRKRLVVILLTEADNVNTPSRLNICPVGHFSRKLGSWRLGCLCLVQRGGAATNKEQRCRFRAIKSLFNQYVKQKPLYH